MRETAEELGIAVTAPLQPLGNVRQAGGKVVAAFAAAQDLDPAAIRSNRFEIEWLHHIDRVSDYEAVP